MSLKLKNHFQLGKHGNTGAAEPGNFFFALARNPKTGARVDVPAKKVPYFKPSKELRDLVNPGEAAAQAS